MALTLALCLLAASSARAQTTNVDTQIFLPTLTEGTTMTIARPEVLRHGTYAFGLGIQAAGRTFVRGEDNGAVVPWQSSFELQAAVGLFEYLELAMGLPVALLESASNPLAEDIETSTKLRLGDPRLGLKVPIIRGDFSLSAQMLVHFPGGRTRDFAGSSYWSVLPSIVMAWQIGRITLAGELGYRLRQQELLPAFEYNNEIDAKLGGAYALTPRVALTAETLLRAGVGGESIAANEVPMEAALGMRYRLSSAWSIEGSLSTGVLRGYGAPLARGFVMLRYRTTTEVCAEGPEDFDGFQDSDYCADPDNDGDGILDVDDECPNDAEDFDGFQDADGCPDLDNDADGIPDARDECPNEAEDWDGFEDEDGCPDLDNDQDGIPDKFDACPMEPEDIDGYEDEDGCPEPGPNRATVTVSDSKILISERIYFDFDRDTIRSVSKPLLDQVAAVILRLPGKRKVRIEGYTDNIGDPEYNKDLSYRRSRAVVEYLVLKGVPRNRLSYVGYGPIKPVASNETVDGQALNRRVEFTITD